MPDMPLARVLKALTLGLTLMLTLFALLPARADDATFGYRTLDVVTYADDRALLERFGIHQTSPAEDAACCAATDPQVESSLQPTQRLVLATNLRGVQLLMPIVAATHLR